jgi:hypothetical protein
MRSVPAGLTTATEDAWWDGSTPVRSRRSVLSMTTAEAAFAPVTYTMPYARLRRLSRKGTRRSYPRVWYFTWGWIALYLAIFLLVAIFPESFSANVASLARLLGVSFATADLLFFALMLLVFAVGLILNKRRFRAQHAARVDFDSSITLGPSPGGLHLAGAQIEYTLKWPGIHELLCEPDGIVIVCGGLFFLVPDQAFATVAARNAFLDYVAAHLTPEARTRSETELQRARRK